MKLSELSFREYIALEMVKTFFGTMSDQDAALRSFEAADAFLKRAGREHDKITEIKRECDKLEAQVSLLLNMNEDGNFAYRVALMEIWEFLGVDNQTAALEALHARRADRT